MEGPTNNVTVHESHPINNLKTYCRINAESCLFWVNLYDYTIANKSSIYSIHNYLHKNAMVDLYMYNDIERVHPY